MTYDFFTPLPLVGAEACFYHHILHDSSDEYCLKILANLRGVMILIYSKLLLHELILPDKGVSSFESMLDLTMTIFNSGMERDRA